MLSKFASHDSVRAPCPSTGTRRRTLIEFAPLLLLLVLGGSKRDQEAGARASTSDPQVTKQFSDVAERAGITHVHHKPSLDRKLANIDSWVCSVGASAAAGDFNNDGWIDLYVTDSRKGTTNALYRNNGDGTFTDVARKAGVAYLNGDKGTSMDCLWGDYNNDHDVDVFVANQKAPPHLYRNNGTPNNALIVRLEADPKTGINRDAIGTRVTVMTSQGTQVRERDGGNGHSGQSDPRLHFGIGQDETVPLLEVRWPDGGLQYVDDVRANQIVTVCQDPSKYADRVAIAIAAPKAWARKDDAGASAVPKIDPEEMDRQLSEVEEVLHRRPDTYALASEYRRRCAAYEQHERSIRFFEQLVNERPDDIRARIELASAYVDKIPTCRGIAAVVSKGTLARKSLDQLDYVIRKDPDSWVAYYCRAMNHLHWPRALRHSDDSVADFNRCIQLQEANSEAPRPYDVRTYIGLGDAHTKAKEYGLGRTVWRRGLELFPDSEELGARLAVRGDGEQLDYVEAQRNLEQPIDTSLAFLDGAP